MGIDVPVEVVCGGLPGSLHGVSRDLGIGGVAVATASVFSYRSVRRVILHLETGRLELEAEGCWQQEDHAESAVQTGIRFTSLDEPTVSMLWDVVVDRGKDIARFLHGDSDLAHLGVEEAIGLAHASRSRLVRAGRFIYRSDVPRAGDASIFVVLRGEVVLQIRVRNAIEHTIERLGPGRLFGGLAAIEGSAAPESAVASTDVELLEINRTSFEFLLAVKPWLAQRITQAVTRAYLSRTRDLLAKLSEEL